MAGPPDVDLLVAGGGPTGLAAALYAVRLGLSVSVVEPRPGVLDKACGEGLMPAAVAALADLGVHPEPARPFEGIRYVAGRHQAQARFRGAPGLGVRRTALHAALRRQVLAAGIRIRPGRITRVHQDADAVHTDAGTARYLLAADGLASTLRRQVGPVRPPRRQRLGLRRHYAVAPWSPFVEVHWADGAEAYVTPVGDELVAVAILCDRALLPSARNADDRFARLLGAFPALARRLEAPTTPTRGAGPFGVRAHRPAAGRVLLIGDAAGTLDPLTGEGIRLGLATARAAVAAAAADAPAAYGRAWRRITRPMRWLTGGLLWIGERPALRRRIVPTLAAWPSLFDGVVNRLGGDGIRGRRPR